VANSGLRELKKARTHRLIADVAARLFAERGYEHVTVSDIAREAEVSEQTVYNYFPSKEQLVTDRRHQIQDDLVGLIRARAPGVSAAAAVRDYVLASVDVIPSISPELWRGELGYLAVISPTVHRLSLEMSDHQADAIARAIHDTTQVPREIAKLQGIAIASVYQIIFNHAGQRTHEGHSQAEISRELHPVIEAVMDELDRWLRLTEQGHE
jgi:AcrR family transcriptional regulator